MGNEVQMQIIQSNLTIISPDRNELKLIFVQNVLSLQSNSKCRQTCPTLWLKAKDTPVSETACYGCEFNQTSLTGAGSVSFCGSLKKPKPWLVHDEAGTN
jgi:hypothetical protein